MKPGSWLEFSDYNAAAAQKIYSLGQVDHFIVPEDSTKPAPEFPFLILIHDLNNTTTTTWKTHKYFKGFLLRTSADLSTHTISTKEPLWIDYLVTNTKKSLRTVKTIAKWNIQGFFLSFSEKISARKINQLIAYENIKALPRPHDLSDPHFNNWDKLENFGAAKIELNAITEPKLSIIIPHYENPYFLCAVLKHLQNSFEQNSTTFEVLVIDDASSEKTRQHIAYFCQRHLRTLPFRFFTWDEKIMLNNDEKIFRAGASRNWGAALAKAAHLFFLDSDMLTPVDIADLVLKSLEKSDVVQFVRKHVPFELSSETSTYSELINSSKLYYEEAQYWGNLFECSDWQKLSDHWKYTCTYALGMKKDLFLSIGRFRRNFIRYGLEDTDLGFRLYQSEAQFFLNKTPLLHLTPKPDSSQNFIFRIKKINRIAPTAQLFYKLHLDPIIYQKFQSLLD